MWDQKTFNQILTVSNLDCCSSSRICSYSILLPLSLFDPSPRIRWCEQRIWQIAHVAAHMHGQGAPSCHSFDGLKECWDRASWENLLTVYSVVARVISEYDRYLEVKGAIVEAPTLLIQARYTIIDIKPPVGRNSKTRHLGMQLKYLAVENPYVSMRPTQNSNIPQNVDIDQPSHWTHLQAQTSKRSLNFNDNLNQSNSTRWHWMQSFFPHIWQIPKRFKAPHGPSSWNCRILYQWSINYCWHCLLQARWDSK